MTLSPYQDGQRASPIRRISADRVHWRVSVRTWADGAGYRGRLIFESEDTRPGAGTREGPDEFAGPSREDVVRSAHDVPESRLRALLHSLG